MSGVRPRFLAVEMADQVVDREAEAASVFGLGVPAIHPPGAEPTRPVPSVLVGSSPCSPSISYGGSPELLVPTAEIHADDRRPLARRLKRLFGIAELVLADQRLFAVHGLQVDEHLARRRRKLGIHRLVT
jgi:hypothetical protein